MVRPTPSVSRNTLGSNECFRSLFAKLIAFFKVDPPRFRNLARSDGTTNPDCEGSDPLSIKMPGRGLSNIAQSGPAPGPGRFGYVQFQKDVRRPTGGRRRPCFPRGRAGSSRRQFAGEVFPIGMEPPEVGVTRPRLPGRRQYGPAPARKWGSRLAATFMLQRDAQCRIVTSSAFAGPGRLLTYA